ncbi:MAG: hypothetical protein JWP44_1489 [Mucilaginibacter sp.]|nr:hypothetical protein [Mucilaginibacter sp.]
MDKVCVLIRVYNRVEDLKYCLDIIRDTWKNFEYYIIVVTNGIGDGYMIDDDSRAKIDCLVQLENNVGHFNGNSQLLLAGLDSIPAECKYTVLLEADTWLYQDKLIKKYIGQLDAENAVWASAQFFRYILNLATDFAIVKTSIFKAHKNLFVFSKTPEYHVANYLVKNGLKFIYINENMPVSLPKYFRKYPYAYKGRFYTFEKSKMVTHHIEHLADGMEEKKYYFNLVTGVEYFKVNIDQSYTWTRFKIRLAIALSILLPYKSWFLKTKNTASL